MRALARTAIIICTTPNFTPHSLTTNTHTHICRIIFRRCRSVIHHQVSEQQNSRRRGAVGGGRRSRQSCALEREKLSPRQHCQSQITLDRHGTSNCVSNSRTADNPSLYPRPSTRTITIIQCGPDKSTLRVVRDSVNGWLPAARDAKHRWTITLMRAGFRCVCAVDALVRSVRTELFRKFVFFRQHATHDDRTQHSARHRCAQARRGRRRRRRRRPGGTRITGRGRAHTRQTCNTLQTTGRASSSSAAD